ncbi:hypothetical protein SAZ11_57595 [Streptomyces sp. FXJ1.4098]|nr:hypothetical protein [Streptomyces sp. FXJ1.4098]
MHTLRNPDRATLERARRLADLDGPPSHALHPAHDTDVGARMRGALDLAPHAGAYSSQARTKRGNRTCEVLLHEVELWSATAAVRRGIPYPYDALNRIWESVLTQQSHDVLAGAAVARARQDAEDAHHQAARRLTRIVHRALGPGGDVAAHNAAPFARREVVLLDGVVEGAAVAQGLPDGRCAMLAEAPAHGSGPVGIALDGTAPVTVRRTREGHRVLDNGLVRVTVDGDGLVCSLVDPVTGHDVIAPGGRGNLLELHRDEPVADPARTLALGSDRTRRDLIHAQDIELLANGPLVATVRVRRGNGRSVFTQDLTLTAAGPR